LTNILAHTWMTFGNGGLVLEIIEENGVLGVQAQHQQYGLPSTKSFIPLIWDRTQYRHHFDCDSNLEYAKPAYLFKWLSQHMMDISEWFERNPSSSLTDYVLIRKLSVS